MKNQEKRQQRLGNLHDQGNANVFKGKSNGILPIKRQGLSARRALGDLNTNAQLQRDITIGKVAVATAEYEKKSTLNRATVKTNYSHVRSKIDTGLAASKPTIQPSSRPPLRREESTAGLAARAIAKTKAVLKETQQNKTNDENIVKPRKQAQDTKKSSRLSFVTEEVKPVLKESTESLGKLKLAEPAEKASVEKECPPLPPDVEDIDASDNNSPLLMSCYIKDIYHYLTELDLKCPIEPDHLRKQFVIIGKLRATLINWLVEVQRQFSLVLETFHLTVGIIDQYLQAVLNETQQNKTNDENIVKPRKQAQDTKKSPRLSFVTEEVKPVLKESTESLGKLKLAEPAEKASVEKECPPLPPDVEDIDASDNNSPLLMSCYIKDIYHYLTELELKYPIEPDHLRKQSVITGKMRATLIDWLLEVHCQFSLVLETFHLAVGIIDRYLQAVPNVQRNRLQLVGVTAMFLACKYEEICAPDVSDFVYLTDNAYSKADVFQCERDIMAKLGFCLAWPTPLSFLRRFVKAAHGTSKNHHLANYFVDLSLVEYSMAHYRPSELAAAALCLSLYLLSRKSLEEVWTPTMIYYSEYTLEHIDPIIRRIAKIVVNVKNSKYKAVYNRYLDPKLARVSALRELKGGAIQELAKTL